ncbi:unnamed protein product [Peniophora sp. CBMAI 1063]|nr:unnamed protein product [Peniophora sp. CBMAI 1063]
MKDIRERIRSQTPAPYERRGPPKPRMVRKTGNLTLHPITQLPPAMKDVHELVPASTATTNERREPPKPQMVGKSGHLALHPLFQPLPAMNDIRERTPTPPAPIPTSKTKPKPRFIRKSNFPHLMGERASWTPIPAHYLSSNIDLKIKVAQDSSELTLRRVTEEDAAEEEEVKDMLFRFSSEESDGGSMAMTSPRDAPGVSLAHDLSDSRPGTIDIVVESCPHKLKAYDTSMTSFRSRGPRAIARPPLSMPGVKAHDIFMHCTPGGRQIWRATAELKWVRAELDMVHPVYRKPQYDLHLSNDNWARWILHKTLVTYYGRQKLHFT